MRSLRVFAMREQRVERILQALKHEGLSQMLIVDPMSVYYLTDYYNLPYERFFGLLLRKDGQHVLFLNKLFYAPVNSGVKEVWFSDTDPVAEVLAPYLMQDEVLGVDKEITARFLLPLMERKLAAGFVNSSLAVDKTPPSTMRRWRVCVRWSMRGSQSGKSEISSSVFIRNSGHRAFPLRLWSPSVPMRRIRIMSRTTPCCGREIAFSLTWAV